MQFSGLNIPLEKAIKADDAAAAQAAIKGGADVNARGKHDVTPLEYAVGIRSKNAAAVLIENGADPNLKDAEGDSAVSLAVSFYHKDPELLYMVMDAGGDPNAKRRNGNPVIQRFINDHNLDAISYLHSKGADLNLDISGEAMIINTALRRDWDVVLRLLELGASIEEPRTEEAIVSYFKRPERTPPDSPLYPAKVKVYDMLKAKGLNPVPPMAPNGSVPAPAKR